MSEKNPFHCCCLFKGIEKNKNNVSRGEAGLPASRACQSEDSRNSIRDSGWGGGGGEKLPTLPKNIGKTMCCFMEL